MKTSTMFALLGVSFALGGCTHDNPLAVTPSLSDLGHAAVVDPPVGDGGPQADLHVPEAVIPPEVMWPTRCDLPSVEIPMGTLPIRAACMRLHHAAGVRQRVCGRLDSAGGGGPEFVDNCVAMATAPGSVLMPQDIDACAGDTCQYLCDDLYTGCLFSGGPSTDLLYPNHDKKGILPPGAACSSGIQCDSGYCSDRCGVCQRAVGLGGSCAPGPGEPAGIARCLRGQCVNGTCDFKGLPDGTPCTWYYGTEGCAHRCLQPGFNPPGRCAPLGKAGEWCGGANNSPECEPGLACVGELCVPILPDGAPCVPNRDRCAHQCINGTCGRIAYGRGVGDDCTYDRCLPELRCQNGRCAANALPDLGGADMAVHYLPAGAQCGNPRGTCEPGLTCVSDCRVPGCDPYSGRCTAPPAIGDACVYSWCGGGINRECYQGRCVLRSGEGGPCPCLPQAYCKSGRCIAYGPEICGP